MFGLRFYEVINFRNWRFHVIEVTLIWYYNQIVLNSVIFNEKVLVTLFTLFEYSDNHSDTDNTFITNEYNKKDN